MFKAARVMWAMNKTLAQVCFENGERDKNLPGKIIAKDELGDEYEFMNGELSFLQEVDVYRGRYVKDAAVMILLSTAAAWKAVGNQLFSSYCLEAASRIAYEFYKREQHEISDFLASVYLKNLEGRHEWQKRHSSREAIYEVAEDYFNDVDDGRQ